MGNTSPPADTRKRSHTHTEDSEARNPPQVLHGNGTRAGVPAQSRPVDGGEYRSRKKIVACTNCRQSKLRCDSPRDPCSRCERLGLTCSKDMGYKRVNKKTKVDELEQQVQELKASMQTSTFRAGQGTMTSSPGAPSYGLPAFLSQKENNRGNNPDSLTNQHLPPVANSGQQLSWTAPTGSSQIAEPALDSTEPQYTPIPDNHRLTALADAIEPPIFVPISGSYTRPSATKVRAIESTALDQPQIDDLFDIYFQTYHTFLPLLDPFKSPDVYYDNSPLLFWTIIGVAARTYPDDPSLDITLSKVVTKLAWERVADPPLPLAGIQALCILCSWPSTTMHLWSDISMSLSNILMTSAMHMGLHRPDHAHEFSRNPRKRGAAEPLTEAERFERGKTWAVCNIVSQYMTANFGHPPVVSCFDWSIDRSCEVGNAHSLSDKLRHHLMIQRLCHRASLSMTTNASDPLGLPSDQEYEILMRLFEHDVEVIEGEIGNGIAIVTKFYLLVARLHLHIFHWLRPTMTDGKRTGLLKSYATASTIINTFYSIDSASGEAPGILRHSPIVLSRVAFQAGYLIFKILNSNLAQFVNYEAGAITMETAQVVLRRMSAAENDLAVRASNILNDLWTHRNEDRDEQLRDPALALRSHLTASMTYDAAWRWHTQRHRLLGDSVGPGAGITVRPGQRDGKSDAQLPPQDPTTAAFNWDMFEDMNWTWAFDIPPQ